MPKGLGLQTLASLFAAGALCSTGVSAGEGQRRQMAAVLVQEAPVIDGRLDESAWKGAKFKSGFVHIHEGLPATPDTSFAVLASPTHLYIGVICHEPHPEKMVKEGAADSIELFLDPERTGHRYIYLKLDVLGRLRIILEDYGKIGSYYGRGRQKSGFTKPESAVRIGDNAWVAELAIPFAGSGVAPETGGRWHFNICRNNLTLPEKVEGEFRRNYRRLSSWGRLQPGEQFVGVGDFNLFGILSGVPSPVYSAEEVIEVQKLREKAGMNVEVTKAPFKLHSGIVYKRIDGVEVDLNIYELESDSPAPAIMWLHGGAMMSGVNEMEIFQRDLFLNWGYSIVSANYRLPPEGKWPAYKDDIVDAFDWIHENGARFNIDTGRLGVAGLSAGGYLSYLLGVQANQKPRVVVSFSGYAHAEDDRAPSDAFELIPEKYRAALSDKPLPESSGDHLREEMKASFNARHCWVKGVTGYFPHEEGAQEVLRQAWPIFQVTPDYPPTFIYHGTSDTKLYASSARFAEALKREGVVHHFASIENGGHAILRGFMSNEHKSAGLEKLREFLEEHLK